MNRKELKVQWGKQSGSDQAFKEFVNFFDFPLAELELERVQHFFVPLMQEITALSPQYPEVKINPEWHTLAHMISTMEIPPRSNVAKSAHPPLWGEYTKNPAYVALQFCPQGVEQNKYLIIMANILFARTIIKPKTKSHPEYKNVLVTAPASLRKVGVPPYLSFLSTIETNCAPRQLAANISKSELAEELAPLCTLLGYLCGKNAPNRDDIRRYATKDTKPNLHLLTTTLDEDNFDTPQLTIISQKTTADIEERMMAPGEISHAQDLVLLNEAEATNKLQTMIQGMARAQRAANTAMKKHNQLLPYAWESLSVYEVKQLWQAILSLSGKDQVLASFLALVLVTGQSAETVCGFEIYPHDSTPIDHQRGLMQKNGVWCWVSIPYTPNVAKPSACLQVAKAQDYLLLEIPAPVQTLLTEKSISAIKKFNPHALDEKAKEFVSHLNDTKHLRLTVDRISHFLSSAIRNEEHSDIATTMLIGGNYSYTGTVVSHYTGQQIQRLNNIYSIFWERIIGHSQPQPAVEFDKNQIVGSTRIPLAKVLNDLIEQSFEALVVRKLEAEQENTIAAQIRLHNSYTRYVAIMVAYSTGVRAVTSPMPRRSEIDMATNFYPLSDKDSSDRYHTRLMWLNPMCLDQLLHYWSHARQLVNRISVLQPDFFTHIRTRRSRRIENEIFFLRRDGVPEEITPKVLHDFSKLPCAVYLPDNAHRHLLRSWLLERNCPPEIINAYMGHWCLGQEPWSRYSGLSPQIYRETLNQHLPILMKQLGFRVFNPSLFKVGGNQ